MWNVEILILWEWVSRFVLVKCKVCLNFGIDVLKKLDLGW